MLELEIKELNPKDFKRAIDFAIEGMHFDRYVENKVALRLYGRYFLYLELERSTQALAAYMGEDLVGVLLAEINGEAKHLSSFWRKIYIKAFEAVMNILLRGESDVYDEANKAMYAEYLKRASPDGEICFLAADPTIQGKGIGAQLLEELTEREKGKLIFLYTDSNCTYQFYERKGFERAVEKQIEMNIAGKNVELTCLFYCKQL
ncbi:MAG: GNAT family N-acetyltransferase [Raoultibacter sp.]|jgi:GNAT superfamily N-acetyltransferase